MLLEREREHAMRERGSTKIQSMRGGEIARVKWHRGGAPYIMAVIGSLNFVMPRARSHTFSLSLSLSLSLFSLSLLSLSLSLLSFSSLSSRYLSLSLSLSLASGNHFSQRATGVGDVTFAPRVALPSPAFIVGTPMQV